MHVVGQGGLPQMSVDVFTVADFYNYNEQNFVLNLINNTEIS